MTSSHVKRSSLGPDEEDERSVASINRPKSTSPSTKEASPSSSASPHPLQFITLTERPSSQKNDYSYTVRSHAMQSFLREKKNAKADHLKPKSPAPKEHDQQTPKELSGKFKLATWSRKPRTRKTKTPTSTSRENSAESVSMKEEDVHSEGSSAPIESYDHALPNSLIDTHILELLYHCITPVSLCPLCQTTRTDDIPLINPNITWDPSTTTDPALFHAALCLVAQNQDLLRGGHESPETLFHKGEAMMLMNRRLIDRSHVISDADITAVAIFVILESINGTFEAASAHRIGLLKMVKLQGSIRTFEENDIALGVLAWSDIVFSTRFGLPPKFSYIWENTLSSFDISSTSEDPYSAVFEDSTTTTSILHSLRYISSTIDNADLSTSDKKAIADAIYHTEYTILTSPQLSSFQQQIHSPSSSPHPQHLDPFELENQSPSQLLTISFHISSLLYLQTQIHNLPNPTLLHQSLVSHLLPLTTQLSTLSSTLRSHHTQNPQLTPHDLTNIDPLLSPQTPIFSHQETNILLWILFIGLTTSTDFETKRSFTRLLRDVVGDGEIEGLEERVKGVVWRGSIKWEGVLEEILGEVGN